MLRVNESELLGEGGFAQVYAHGPTLCVKVARTSARTTGWDARALRAVTGSFSPTPVSPAQVLMEQYQRLQERRHDRHWVQVEGLEDVLFADGSVRLGMVMARVSGQPLDARHPLGTIAKVARIVAGTPHWDLKPDHVFVQDDGSVVLIDPGHMNADNRITTPLYNPYCEPSDVASLGLLLCHVMIGRNPFSEVLATQGVATARLVQQLEAARNLGTGVEFYRLLHMPPWQYAPRYTNAVVADRVDVQALEAVALRALSARRDSAGVLHQEAPYVSPQQFAEALERL